MDFLTFLSQVVSSVAWPAVVLTVGYGLRDEVRDLLRRLNQLKHKDTELNFNELRQAAKEGSEEAEAYVKELEKKLVESEQLRQHDRLELANKLIKATRRASRFETARESLYALRELKQNSDNPLYHVVIGGMVRNLCQDIAEAIGPQKILEGNVVSIYKLFEDYLSNPQKYGAQPLTKSERQLLIDGDIIDESGNPTANGYRTLQSVVKMRDWSTDAIDTAPASD